MPSTEDVRSIDGRVEWLKPALKILDAREDVLNTSGAGSDLQCGGGDSNSCIS